MDAISTKRIPQYQMRNGQKQEQLYAIQTYMYSE
jgi:hypothetical protein